MQHVVFPRTGSGEPYARIRTLRLIHIFAYAVCKTRIIIIVIYFFRNARFVTFNVRVVTRLFIFPNFPPPELRGRTASVRKVGGMQQGGHVSMAVGGETMQVSSGRAAVLANAFAGRRAYHHGQNKAIQGKNK